MQGLKEKSNQHLNVQGQGLGDGLYKGVVRKQMSDGRVKVFVPSVYDSQFEADGNEDFLPNAEIMIHQPLISGGLSGQCTDIKIQSDHLLRIRERMNTILAENTGKPLETIQQDTERDNYMTAQEAMDYGLIDKVITKRQVYK